MHPTIAKVLNFLWTFKPMILLYYSMYADFNSMINEMAVGTAKQEAANGDVEWLGQNLKDMGKGSCLNDTDGTVIMICQETFNNHPVRIFGLVFIALSTVFGFITIVRLYLKLPDKYGTVEYYASLSMLKKSPFFKKYIKIMYGVIFLLIFINLAAFIAVAVLAEVILGNLFVGMLSTIVLSGIAVSELRTTNEINFEYSVNELEEDIYFDPEKISCMKTAEQIFEELEEAVSVYSITGKSKLLKELLKVKTDAECQRVIGYYKFVYAQEKGQKHSDNVDVRVVQEQAQAQAHIR